MYGSAKAEPASFVTLITNVDEVGAEYVAAVVAFGCRLEVAPPPVTGPPEHTTAYVALAKAVVIVTVYAPVLLLVIELML